MRGLLLTAYFCLFWMIHQVNQFLIGTLGLPVCGSPHRRRICSFSVCDLCMRSRFVTLPIRRHLDPLFSTFMACSFGSTCEPYVVAGKGLIRLFAAGSGLVTTPTPADRSVPVSPRKSAPSVAPSPAIRNPFRCNRRRFQVQLAARFPVPCPKNCASAQTYN